MTLGEKLKDARKQAGLSQEQLAEKLAVSRSAVAKWETDKGIPDVANLKAISKLLNVSIDYLLDDGEAGSPIQLKEAIDLKNYEVTGKCRVKEDAVVLSKYPEASIYPLIRSKKLNKIEWIADFLTSPGIFEVVDSLNDMSYYYLVETESKQFLVNVTKEFIVSTEMPKKITGNKFVVGKNKFMRGGCKLTE